MTGWGWAALPRLAATLRRHRPDGVVLIYSSWLYGHEPMITYLPSVLARVCPGARLFTLLETYDLQPPPGRAARIGRRLAAAAARESSPDYVLGTLLGASHTVAALGPTIVAQYAQRDPTLPQRAVVVPPPPLVPPAADTSPAARRAARTDLGVTDDELLLAYFGYVYPGKGVDTLVRAVAQLAASGRRVRLVMAGGGRTSEVADRHGGYEDEIRALASSLGVHDAIVWPAGYGPGGDAAVGRQLLAADMAVLPFDDGAELRRSSIAVVVAAGLPLVTTRPQGPETAFVELDNVLMCEPRDPAALAKAIVRIAADPTLSRKLAWGAATLAETHFSWRRAVDAIVQGLSADAPSADGS